MTLEEDVREFHFYLAVYNLVLGDTGRLGLTTSNSLAERFYARLLNHLYGWNLRDANEPGKNEVAVDLIDDEHSIVVQVTATCTSKKINDTLKSTKIRDYCEKGYKLKFVFIGDQHAYKQVQSAQGWAIHNPHGIAFDRRSDALFTANLISRFMELEPKERSVVLRLVRRDIGVPNLGNSTLVLVGSRLKSGINACLEIIREACSSPTAPMYDKQRMHLLNFGEITSWLRHRLILEEVDSLRGGSSLHSMPVSYLNSEEFPNAVLEAPTVIFDISESITIGGDRDSKGIDLSSWSAKDLPRGKLSNLVYDLKWQDVLLSKGIVLDRYRIVELLGRGGVGTVLECWDERLNRRVAIKAMRLDANDEGMNSMLSVARREANAISMMNHHGVVAVYDFDYDQYYSYLVMEYIDGINLAELLRSVDNGVLSFDETAYIVQEVAQALAFAHDNGVLHLDIKPSNIMISRSGLVKLCDFGMALHASSAGYGRVFGGTVGYMPPEQMLCEMVDERADVFSLAVVTWQMLFGSPPFKLERLKSTGENSLDIIRKGPPRPSELDSRLSGVAEEVLLRALEAMPSDRIRSVGLFASSMVPALGDPESGMASLRNLIGDRLLLNRGIDRAFDAQDTITFI